MGRRDASSQQTNNWTVLIWQPAAKAAGRQVEGSKGRKQQEAGASRQQCHHSSSRSSRQHAPPDSISRQQAPSATGSRCSQQSVTLPDRLHAASSLAASVTFCRAHRKQVQGEMTKELSSKCRDGRR